MKEYILMWQNAFDFRGRSRRREYWMSLLFNILIAIGLVLLAVITELPFFMALYGIYAFLAFIPAISLSVRRLHDVGKSGWWYLVGLIPFGGFYILYLFVQDSERGVNKWGEDPKKAER